MSAPQGRNGKKGGPSDLRPKIELVYWYMRDPTTGGFRLKHRKDAINRD